MLPFFYDSAKIQELKRPLLLLCFLALLSGCSGSREKNEDHVASTPAPDSTKNSGMLLFRDCPHLYAEARRMDSILLKQTEIDHSSATQAISAFANFANYCSKDSLSPVFLIKCAQVAKAINNIPQAKIALEKCVKDYPGFRDRPAALFLLAQLYDEDTYLNDEIEAKRLYEEIISNYPKSDWALSAKGAIHFLGKSDEQIMNELKKK